MRAFAQRLERLGPRYNALALPLTAAAIRRARDVDKEFKRERYRGPLQGIPFGAKDLLSYAGQPTTWGARPYAAQVFDETATVLEKLDKTGCGADRQARHGGTGGRRRLSAPRARPCSAPDSIPGIAPVGRADPPADRAARWQPAWFRLRLARKRMARS